MNSQQGFKCWIILTMTALCHGAETNNRWQIKERDSTPQTALNSSQLYSFTYIRRIIDS